MDDRAALYAAVCANPEDDTPQLVYADYLQEQGETRLAAFIRYCVDLFRRQRADTEAAHVYNFLRGEADDEIQRIDWSKLDPELAAIVAADVGTEKTYVSPKKREMMPRFRGVTFERVYSGFPCEVVVDFARDFVKHAATIFRSAPITDLTIDVLDTDDAQDLVNSGYLARIRYLIIRDVPEPEALEILGNHPDAAGVQDLELGSTTEAIELAHVLFRGKHWTGLKLLSLSEFTELTEDLDDDDEQEIARLFRNPVFRGLHELIADESGFSDPIARAIASGGLPELRRLDLSFNEITGDGAEAIARSKGLPNLQWLDLSANSIEGDDALAAVIASPRLPKLSALSINGELDRPNPKLLGSASRGPTLRALDLSCADLTAAGAAALAACPAFHGLWYLNLDNASLTTTGLRALLKSPGLDQLTWLNLEDNSLTVQAAKAIANWPKATALQWLGLADNSLTKEGIEALADSPYLTGLKYLTVSGSAQSTAMKKLKKRLGKGLELPR